MLTVNTNNEGKFNIKGIISKFGIILALILLCLFLSVFTDSFLSTSNLINILRQVSVIGLISLGMTFVIITAGIDLSVGSVVAFSGVVAASFATTDNILIAVGLGILAGLLLGFINGFVIAQWKIAAFIVTLGMMTIGRGLTFIYSDGQPVSGLSSNYLAIGQSNFLGLPLPVWILAIAYIFCHLLLYKTRLGRHIYAVGGNPQAATFSGINVKRIKIIVYSISGLLAGVAGVVLSSRVSAGLPQAGTTYELDAIAAVVIGGTSLAGGRGVLWGTMIGVLIMGVVSNGLDLMGVSSYFQQIVKGVIIILAVLLDSKRSD